jgi:hypothetical protein
MRKPGLRAKHPLRNQNGSNILEFAAALMLLVVFVFIPLLDLAIVPIRWMMAQEIVNSYVRILALSESYGEAKRTMEADPSLRTRLLRLGGVEEQSLRLYLKITHVPRDYEPIKFVEIGKPGTIPPQWLPDGAFAPCDYLLIIDAQLMIAPAVLVDWRGVSVPGLTRPFPMQLRAAHEWSNLGRNPDTEKYVINE